MKDKKKLARMKRKRRVRSRVKGTSERPRLNVFRSLKHIIYAQAIEDSAGRTLDPGQVDLTVLFDYPTISQLAKHLEAKLRG